MARIRKAEDPEKALSDALAAKLQDVGLQALRDEAIRLLTNGQFDAFAQVMQLYSTAQDYQHISSILFDSSQRAGMDTLAEKARAFQAGLASQTQQVPVLVGTTIKPLPPITIPPSGVMGITFNALDQNVIAWADARAANLVVQISEEMRSTIRGIIGEAVRGSATAQQAARKIARVVPLHERYARAVLRYEDTQFSALVRGGMDPMKAMVKAAERADRYALKLTRSRAQTIARTEIQFATNHGQYMGYEAAMNSGALSGLLVTKEWVTAEDEDVCPICGPLDKQQVPFDGLFAGKFNHPPAHPRCRCAFNIIDNLASHDFGYGV